MPSGLGYKMMQPFPTRPGRTGGKALGPPGIWGRAVMTRSEQTPEFPFPGQELTHRAQALPGGGNALLLRTGAHVQQTEDDPFRPAHRRPASRSHP